MNANSLEHLNTLLDKKIDGVIVSIDKLSVNDSFYVDVDALCNIDFKGKEVFVSLNKLMHNSDLEYLRIVLKKLNKINVRILFYDMAVYNIACEYDMVNKLVIYQDHLNASVLSNKFYFELGIKGSFVTSDITRDELIEIKKNSGMEIMLLGYGYAPIFYSRRYLIKNYHKYIDKEYNSGNYSIISDTGVEYPIEEEDAGTTIYTDKVINLINQVDEIKDIDYLVLRCNKIDDLEFNNMVDKFINHERVENTYLGFYDKKTIYRVK